VIHLPPFTLEDVPRAAEICAGPLIPR